MELKEDLYYPVYSWSWEKNYILQYTPGAEIRTVLSCVLLELREELYSPVYSWSWEKNYILQYTSEAEKNVILQFSAEAGRRTLSL